MTREHPDRGIRLPNLANSVGLWCLGLVWSLVLAASGLQVTQAQIWDSSPSSLTSGSFWRFHWYERGLTNGNPKLESRFRVNSPEVVLHPAYGKREEARANGLMLIPAEERSEPSHRGRTLFRNLGWSPRHSQQADHHQWPQHLSPAPRRYRRNQLHVFLSECAS